METVFKNQLDKAVASRMTFFDSRHESAFRLFNGFHEGHPDLTLDVYQRTLLIHNYADDPSQNHFLIQQLAEYLQTKLDWLQACTTKTRNAKKPEEKCGQLLFGYKPDRKIKEHGIWYAIDLTMNRDASFYLDTSHLRKWMLENMGGKSVLNTFAYTGSLGVAASAGGSSHVVQTDRSRRFLNLAKESYTLNGFPVNKRDFIVQDFFPAIAKFKSTSQLFDCVVADPPFFSTTNRGRIDLINESARVINKIRPLVNDGGYLVSINNALFVSGREYMQMLRDLCQDGYLKIEDLIPVPEEFVGFERVENQVSDPMPFNHSTKIAILRVRRRKLP